MTSAEDYATMADWATQADPLRRNPPARSGETFFTGNDSAKQEWQITDLSAIASDGFQAIAVAPVVNGVKDESHIYIAYAGTNFDDSHDLATDVGVAVNTKPQQIADALEFARTVKKLHKGSTFETVGHSLGGYQAMVVAAENRWPGTTFNAPDAWNITTPATQAWLKKQNEAGTNPLTNYVNMLDIVGNLKGNKSGAAKFVKDVPNRSMPDYHSLGKDQDGKPFSFAFDASGNIIGLGANQVDFGVILYNLGLTGPADTVWAMDKKSPYREVLVHMEPAIAMADRIHGLAEKLRAIKAANKGLASKMQAALKEAKWEYASSHQWVTQADVENCAALHALDVDQNVDLDAVQSVNRLVDHHLKLVDSLHRGIKNAVVNTLAHDVHSAAAFTRQ